MQDAIRVVFTGGTIGSRKSGKVIDVDGATAFDLLGRYRGLERARDIAFDTAQPYQALSENLNPAHWTALIACLLEPTPEQYRGVIVTHGSDTLPFTAAALSYAFAHAGVPIVLVAGDYPLDDGRSNGLRNFAAAVDFILDAALPGVYVTWANDPGDCAVYLGTRLTEALPFTDRFDGPYGTPLGYVREGRFESAPHEVNPKLSELRAERLPVVPPEQVRFSTRILFIRPYPGLDYGLYRFSAVEGEEEDGGDCRKPAAVLHGLYHSATANVQAADGFRSSFEDFAAYCAARGIDVYVAPVKAADADQYRSAAGFLGQGLVVGLPKISVEAALVKLMLAYGTFDSTMERDRFLGGSVFFEHHESEG
ncbi:asparaginase [Paenibacillus darwinianus]|uniref:asparaginase n=1 Tax=Paenibacillus darwinianus TaxID=1380763 RepID=A0A9W5W6T8_9BACL|nr:asparaginase domain-containing protein [Paenibacillus darwinianus]EXX85907.1 asparaginase [Paenibacillus darwinianus]EXX86820.1 asparaginase [Paenibacillus darwinianus]EXX87987.1 asparaginase [Paenibacillus darwinianus]